MKYSSKSDIILDIKGLDISFNLNSFYSKSLRDIFIEMINSPIKFLFKRTKTINIIKDLHLTIKRGERVGLIGVNGAGKTSLCRTITGMFGSKKEIEINGLVRAIFDTTSVVYPELSGRENAWIVTNILYSHLSLEERASIIEDSLEFSELQDFLDQPFKNYSMGMKARLSLSIVSARPCELLILDEVFNGADQFFNEKITKRIKGMIQESGAVLFISHSEDLILDVCNRVIVLGNQKILFDGKPQDALRFYKEKFQGNSLNQMQFS